MSDLAPVVAAVCDHLYACTPDEVPNEAARVEGILIAALPELGRMFTALLADRLDTALPRLACGLCHMEFPVDDRGGHDYHGEWFKCHPDFEMASGLHIAVRWLRKEGENIV